MQSRVSTDSAHTLSAHCAKDACAPTKKPCAHGTPGRLEDAKRPVVLGTPLSNKLEILHALEACWECSQGSPLRPTYHTTGARAHNVSHHGGTGSAGSTHGIHWINAASMQHPHSQKDRYAKSDKTCKNAQNVRRGLCGIQLVRRQSAPT